LGAERVPRGDHGEDRKDDPREAALQHRCQRLPPSLQHLLTAELAPASLLISTKETATTFFARHRDLFFLLDFTLYVMNANVHLVPSQHSRAPELAGDQEAARWR